MHYHIPFGREYLQGHVNAKRGLCSVFQLHLQMYRDTLGDDTKPHKSTLILTPWFAIVISNLIRCGQAWWIIRLSIPGPITPIMR